MKNVIQKLTLLISITSSSFVAADLPMKKPAFRVDFNKMIDENSAHQSELQKAIASKVAKKQKKTKRQDSKRREVIDFVDVEVSWDETTAPVADRRFDSVGGPKVLDLQSAHDSGS